MTLIFDEITKLQTNLSNSYTACQNKGATIPAHQNFNNLAGTIDDITTSLVLELKKEGNSYYIETQDFEVDSSVTTISKNNYLQNAFTGGIITSADLSSVTTITGNSSFNNTFKNCTKLISFDFSNLTTITGASALSYCFANTSVTTCSFPELVNVQSYGLQNVVSNCLSLTSVSLPKLTTIGNYGLYNAFSGCTNLTTVTFPKLTNLSGQFGLSSTFSNCTSLTTLSFPALTASSFGSYSSQFNNMLSGCSGVTVHFPYTIYSTIKDWASVSVGFGGTNTTILYDIGMGVINFTFNVSNIVFRDDFGTATNKPLYTNLTVVGFPDYDKETGILGPCTTSNYIDTKESLTFSESWECTVKFKSPSVAANEEAVIGERIDCRGFRIHTLSGHFAFLCGNGSWFNTRNAGATSNSFTGAYNILPSTIYWVKCGWNKATNTYYLKYSTDGINYTDDISYLSSSEIYSFQPYIGRCSQSWASSSIIKYLSDFSLKINNVEKFNFLETNNTYTSFGIGTYNYDIYYSDANLLEFRDLKNIQEGETRNVTIDSTPTSSAYAGIHLNNVGSSQWNNLLASFTIDNLNIEPIKDNFNHLFYVKILDSTNQSFVKTARYKTFNESSLEDLSGTFNFNGYGNSVELTPRSAQLVDFTVPTLSANGTMGGSSFAVSSTYSSSTYAIWKAFDKSSSTYARLSINNSFTFYNPDALFVTAITFNTDKNFSIASVEGSSDNNDWEDLTYTYNSSTKTITLAGINGYKYHRVTVNGWTGSTLYVYEISVTSKIKQIVS